MKYRIICKGNLFYPQYKLLWIWWDYLNCYPAGECFYTTPMSFDTCDEAKDFLPKDVDLTNIQIIQK